MGGEITWRCSGTQYIFTLKLYRDCNGIPQTGNITMNSNSPAGNINMIEVDINDISPTGANCPTCIAPLNSPNAVEEHIYESAPITLNGVPPAGGWYFAYSDCCRNGSVTNLGAGGGWFTLRAIMYPYNGQNTNPCFDNSPQFAERPQLATCAGDTTYYNANAIDLDLDSLVYSWDRPLDGSPYTATTPYPFAPTYSFNSPLPGPALNPQNVAAVLNPTNGVVYLYIVTGKQVGMQ